MFVLKRFSHWNYFVFKYYYIVLVFSTNMTRFKRYSYLIEDRKVLKPSILGLENSFLKAAFHSRALNFPCLSKFWHQKYLIQANFFSERTKFFKLILIFQLYFFFIFLNFIKLNCGGKRYHFFLNFLKYLFF